MRIIVILVAFFNAFSFHLCAQSEFVYRIPGILEIKIPDTMEMEAGTYGQIAQKYADYIEIKTNSVVFHQKGLNELSQDAFSTYARILISYELGPNEFGPVIQSSEIPLSDMLYLDGQFKSNVVAELKYATEKLAKAGQGPLKLYKWFGTSLNQYKGFSSIASKYTRTLGNAKAVYVETHNIFTQQNLIHVTISCRLEERDSKYSAIFKVLNSLVLFK